MAAGVYCRFCGGHAAIYVAGISWRINPITYMHRSNGGNLIYSCGLLSLTRGSEAEEARKLRPKRRCFVGDQNGQYK